MSEPPKRFVYLIRNLNSGRRYVGITSDVAARLGAHNAECCTSTARYKPREVLVAIEFAEEEPALRFGRYLKSGSGWEFSGATSFEA